MKAPAIVEKKLARTSDCGNLPLSLFFLPRKRSWNQLTLTCGCRLARSTPTSRTITTTSNNSNSNNRRVNHRCRVLAREGPAGRGAAWPGPEACSATTAPRASQRRDYRHPWSILSPRLIPVSKNSIPPAAGARTRYHFFTSQLSPPSSIFDRASIGERRAVQNRRKTLQGNF